MANLPHFPQFNVSDQVSLGLNWERWLNRLENVSVALNITADNRKKAMLLHYAGAEVYDMYMYDDGDTYADVKEKISTHFKPTKHTQFRVFEFRQTHQLPNETVDAYVIRLWTLAKDCEFHSIDSEIIGQITQGCTHTSIRRKSLKPDINLKTLLEFARTLESTEKEATLIESSVPPHESVKYISQNSNQVQVKSYPRQA
jgi:hypothetical protein